MKKTFFTLVLILALTPACKQKNKPNLAGPHGAIAAGTILTTGGTATAIGAVTLGAMCAASEGLGALIPFIASVSCAAATPILLAIGIPLLVMGTKKRKARIKRFKEQQQSPEAITIIKELPPKNLSAQH